MDLSILIVAYNSGNYLRNCLDSILQSETTYEFEIIVVDNNSTDNIRAVVNNYSDVILISNSFNYGFSVAMNQAFKVAKGRYVMSFNPDAVLLKDTLESGINFLDENLKVGMVAFVENTQNGVIHPKSKFYLIEIPHLVKLFLSPHFYKKSNQPYRVNWIFGTGQIIKKSILGSELYSERSFLFWEEFGLCEKIKKASHEIFVLPNAKIIHHGSVTFKKDANLIYMARLLSFSHEWRVRSEHFGHWNAIINFVLYVIDNFILFIGLKLKSFAFGPNRDRSVEIADKKSLFKAALTVLFSSSSQIEDINREAIVFFNSGVYPVFPPVQIEN